MPETHRPRFERYVGIDYSGAETPASSLPGLRVFRAEGAGPALEVEPAGTRKYWTRRGIAEWLLARLTEGIPTLVGIDHGFSFPLAYFEKHGLPLEWPVFLEDFQRHWPTDDDRTYVDFVREGICGAGAERLGSSRWRRLTEIRAGGAKSVFHFDVPGSVAKSTHAGLPWLLFLRRRARLAVHFWPFDGWIPVPGRSLVAEIYPSRWNRDTPRGDRTPDQHDAYVAARWLQAADRGGALETCLEPDLTPEDKRVAAVEGWILGVD